MNSLRSKRGILPPRFSLRMNFLSRPPSLSDAAPDTDAHRVPSSSLWGSYPSLDFGHRFACILNCLAPAPEHDSRIQGSPSPPSDVAALLGLTYVREGRGILRIGEWRATS